MFKAIMLISSYQAKRPCVRASIQLGLRLSSKGGQNKEKRCLGERELSGSGEGQKNLSAFLEILEY
jgi:hypothetical protein